MGFFEPPPRAPEPEPEVYVPSPWEGPPANVLGMPVGVRSVLVRREDLAIAVVSAVAFATGLRFDVRIMLRDADAGDEPFIPPWAAAHRRRGAGDDPLDEVFRFGVLLADGGKATNFGMMWPDGPQERPNGPVLAQF